MANIKELRGRIKSIAGIAKITKAMEMVASMKLRKVQARTVAFRPYTKEIRDLMAHLAEFVGEDADLPLFRRRDTHPKSCPMVVRAIDRSTFITLSKTLLAISAIRAPML